MSGFNPEKQKRAPEEIEFSKEKLALEERVHQLTQKVTERLVPLSALLYDENLHPRIPFPDPGSKEENPWREYFALDYIAEKLGANLEQGHFNEERNEFLAKGGSLQTEEIYQDDEPESYYGIRKNMHREIDEAGTLEQIRNFSEEVGKLEEQFKSLSSTKA